jgi:hypothetical protein
VEGACVCAVAKQAFSRVVVVLIPKTSSIFSTCFRLAFYHKKKKRDASPFIRGVFRKQVLNKPKMSPNKTKKQALFSKDPNSQCSELPEDVNKIRQPP